MTWKLHADEYHLPMNLCLAAIGEIGELAEIFQWKLKGSALSEVDKNDTRDEIADVFVYCIRLCDVHNFPVEFALKEIVRSDPNNRSLLFADIHAFLNSPTCLWKNRNDPKVGNVLDSLFTVHVHVTLTYSCDVIRH